MYAVEIAKEVCMLKKAVWLKTLGAVLILGGNGTLLVGCEDEGPVEELAEDIEEGVEDAADEVEDAID
jgi:hypothetical protein